MITIEDVLRYEEGFRPRPYYCSEGYPTIGIGTKIGPKGADLNLYQFTVNEDAAAAMLQNELELIYRGLADEYMVSSSVNKDRCVIIESMCYQMGVSGVSKFRKMILALNRGDYDEAAKQALDSKWARQTPARAKRHAEVLRTGDLDATYKGLV